jgi:hypothetical protein
METRDGEATAATQDPAAGAAEALGTLSSLAGLFPGAGFRLEDVEIIGAEEIPRPYRDLLAHRHHMTVTLEAFHRSEVRLLVDDRRIEGDLYARALRLTAGDGGRVVLAGIMRFQMTRCTEPIRREIVAEKTPLGKILIEHCALRRIEPVAYLRVAPGRSLARVFGLDGTQTFAWGRLATIACNLRPVVELLEVVPPERELAEIIP